jgi:hypothetical protein
MTPTIVTSPLSTRPLRSIPAQPPNHPTTQPPNHTPHSPGQKILACTALSTPSVSPRVSRGATHQPSATSTAANGNRFSARCRGKAARTRACLERKLQLQQRRGAGVCGCGGEAVVAHHRPHATHELRTPPPAQHSNHAHTCNARGVCSAAPRQTSKCCFKSVDRMREIMVARASTRSDGPRNESTLCWRCRMTLNKMKQCMCCRHIVHPKPRTIHSESESDSDSDRPPTPKRHCEVRPHRPRS